MDNMDKTIPLDGADQCVACGMCLPHCPTYLATEDEGESPRGRIALMAALARGQLDLTPRLEAHLDRCTGCRSCEDMCPSKVPYGSLLDAARAYIEPRRPRTRGQRLLRRLAMDSLIGQPRRLLPLARGLRLIQWTRLDLLAPAVGLRRLARLLPTVPAPVAWQSYYPPVTSQPQHGDVALFTGCVTNALDGPTLQAGIRVLNRLGYGVHVPKGQGCCGALHQHNGAPDQARPLAERNIQAFAELDIEAIISTASGCGAMLADYKALYPDHAGAPAFGDRVRDINDFVASIPWPEGLPLRPVAARVAVHTPCSLAHSLHRADKPMRILSRIPDLELVQLPDKGRCCGSGGSFMLTQAAMARTLRDPILDDLDASGAEILVSANIGCVLHLRAGIRERGRAEIQVVHPIVLLDQSIVNGRLI